MKSWQPTRAFLRDLRCGERCALSAFIQYWEVPLYRIAYRIVGNAADAEDARQAVLLRVVESPGRLPSDQRIAMWLQRCVINESISILRRRKRRDEMMSRLHSPDQESEGGPWNSTHQQEQERALRESLQQLTPEQRAMLALRFDNELSIREIAQVLNKPHTTVQFQMQTALRRLRSLMSLFTERPKP